MKFAIFNIIIWLLITLIFNYVFLNDVFLKTYYSDQLSIDQISNLLFNKKKWEWVGYLILPIIYILKINLISICIIAGFFFFDKKVSYSKIFKAVVLADIIFFVPQLIKIIWFSFNTNYSMTDIQYFSPGSALSIFDPLTVQAWLLLPLQAFNIFELGFWFLLAYQLKEYFEGDFTASFKNVALSYGSSYVVWVLFVMFLTLNYT